MRSFLGAIRATLRTSYYQVGSDGRPKPYVAFKLDPHLVPDLPAPRPQFEIWVYSPRVEGVHLRFGAGRPRRPALVGPARGLPHRGARPGQGADGEERRDRAGRGEGRLRRQAAAGRPDRPRGGAGRGHRLLPDVHQRAAGRHRQPGGGRRPAGGRAAAAGGAARRRRHLPRRRRRQGHRDVLRHRQPRSRWTTASGSATRSPPAARSATTTRRWASRRAAPGRRSNGTSASWGSTPRPRTSPSWASATCPATCSATGCCCREHIRLVAAFDHRHVFLDPDPDPATSYAERRRLFDLPRSSWADYDTSLISPGGGVYPRTAKSIPITPQVRARR